MEDAGEVDADDGEPVGGVDLVDVDERRGDARVVEGDVELTVGLHREVDEPSSVLEHGHVSDERCGVATGRGDLARHAFHGLGIAVRHDELGALPGEPLRAGLAEP